MLPEGGILFWVNEALCSPSPDTIVGQQEGALCLLSAVGAGWSAPRGRHEAQKGQEFSRQPHSGCLCPQGQEWESYVPLSPLHADEI